MKTEHVDVLIVGAGLSGMTMIAGLCHTSATPSDSGHAPSGALHPWFQ
jgi:hypothetical protein